MLTSVNMLLRSVDLGKHIAMIIPIKTHQMMGKMRSKKFDVSMIEIQEQKVNNIYSVIAYSPSLQLGKYNPLEAVVVSFMVGCTKAY